MGMKDEDKSNEQLLDELVKLRRRVAELEKCEVERKRAEEALPESEEKYRSLVESTVDWIWTIDVEGRVIFSNDAVKDLLGHEVHEILGLSSFAPMHPEDRERQQELYRRCVEQRRGWKNAVIRWLHKDGSVRFFESSAWPALDAEGDLLGFSGIDRDITERKRGEQEARREKERAETYLDIAGVILATVNADENITLVNRKGCEILGYNDEELIGKNWFDLLVPQERRQEIRGVFGNLLAGNIEPVEYYENPLLTKNGEQRLIAFRNTVLRDSSGQISGVLLSGEDITECRQAEEALARSYHELEKRVEERTSELALANQQLKTEIEERKLAEEALLIKERAIESSINAVAFAEFGGHLTYVNKSFLNLWGYDDDREVLGRPALEFWQSQDEASEVLESLLKRGSCRAELVARRKDGSLFDADISASMVADESGKPLHMMGSFVDVTERKQTERKLKTSLKERETLLKEIHHRVKNNLQVISSLLALSRMRTQNRQAINLLTDARSRVYTMALIHSQLYQTDRFDQINMGDHIRQLVDYLSSTYGGPGTSITPRIECSGVFLTVNQAIPCALVLNELISNVYRHAFKGGERGTIEITLRRSSADTVRITVRDDGIGIPEELDLDTSHTLGLQLVSDIVREQLQGTIHIVRTGGTQVDIEFNDLEREGGQG
jgi:PAS domain S-box-containing protein